MLPLNRLIFLRYSFFAAFFCFGCLRLNAQFSRVAAAGHDVNDVVYVKSKNRLFASTSGATASGNTLITIHPNTGAVESSQVILGNPGKLVLSEDEAYIYILMNGAPSVKRYNMATKQIDLTVVVQGNNMQRAKDLSVMPGRSESFAVVWHTLDYILPDVVQLYDRNVARNETYASLGIQNRLLDVDFTLDSAQIYICESNGTNAVIRQAPVNSNGIAASNATYADLVSYSNAQLFYCTKQNCFITDLGYYLSVAPMSGMLTQEASITSGQTWPLIHDLYFHSDSSYMVASLNSGGIKRYSTLSLAEQSIGQLSFSNSSGAVACFGANNGVVYEVNGPTGFAYIYDECQNNKSITITADKTFVCYHGNNLITDSVTLKAPSGYFGYYWFPDNAYSDDSIKVMKGYDLAQYQFYCVAMDSIGCVSNKSNLININLSSPPNAPMIMYDNLALCLGDSVKLFVWDAGQNSTIYWSDGQIGATIYVKTAGEYTCYIESLPGCNSSVSNKVTVVAKASTAPPAPSIIGNQSPYCPGDTIRLSSSSQYFNKWSTGDTSQTTRFTVQTNYDIQLFLQDQTGCRSALVETNIELKNVPNPYLQYTQTILQALYVPIACDTVYWYLNNDLIAQTDLAFLQPTSTGFYEMAYELDGCLSSRTSAILVIITDTDEPQASNSRLQLLPNITSSSAQLVHKTGLLGGKITVTSSSGTLVQTYRATDTPQFEISLLDQSAGWYFVYYLSSDGLERETLKCLKL